MKNVKINNFENYTIYEDGTIVSNERRHPRWGTIIKNDRTMKPNKTGKYRNYLSIRLTDLEGNSKIFKVHRLVASHFIDNPSKLPQINHIDGNTFNNHVSNLEWCDNSHNQKHAYGIGLKEKPIGNKNPMYGKSGAWKGKRGDSHNKSKRVVQLDLNGTIMAGFQSATLAAEAVNGQAGNISKVCRGINKKASGFKWIFATEEHKYLFDEYLQNEGK